MVDPQNHYDNVSHKLTLEQKQYAAEVLNETDENREHAIAEIKRWIQENDLCARTGKNYNNMLTDIIMPVFIVIRILTSYNISQ